MDYRRDPRTTFVTISRNAAAWINQVALEYLFQDKTPLAIIPADPEGNPDNYESGWQVRSHPLKLAIYAGMRVTITKNINKQIDYVNGMSGIVERMYPSGVRILTKTNYRIMIYPWTDEDRNTFFPLRPGYAHTLLKMQGATLEHLTIYLDVPGVEAAGYVALSRVQHDKDWRFIGDPTSSHFVPAEQW